MAGPSDPAAVRQLRRQLLTLNRVGIALSAERDLDRLLDLILSEGRRLTFAEAGSVYVRRQSRLWFTVSQNARLADVPRTLAAGDRAPAGSVALDRRSLAGYVGVTGRLLNIADAYRIPARRPYRFDRSFDQRTGYRTTSVVVVPMHDTEAQLVGVLQLINARRRGRVVRFGRDAERLLRSLASQAAVAVKNALLTQNLKDAYLDTIFRLSVAAEYKDTDTARHLRRMSRYVAVIARAVGLSQDEAERLSTAAVLHDIGKLGVPDAILMKSGPLTPQERRTMNEHTTFGGRILAGADSPVLRISEVIALTHHEKWDGTGYPRGLKGRDIPRAGRIVAVADVFDALTSTRPYKRAFTLDEAIDTMKADSGTHFDPEVIEAFLREIDRLEGIRRGFGE